MIPHLPLSRRAALLGLTATAFAGQTRLALASAPTEQRFIVVLLRGALDGMAALPPYGDANLAGLRAALVPPAIGQPGGMLDLGGFYGMHPALPHLHGMYQDGEALPVHAIAGPYRTRSHFEAQDLLQLGTETNSISSGWLNRLLLELPAQQGPVAKGLAVGLAMPLLLEGRAPVGAYAPLGLAAAPPDLVQKALALNAPDHVLGPALAQGVREMRFDARIQQAEAMEMSDDQSPMAKGAKRVYGFPLLAQKAGQMLAAPGGPRIAAFELEGWDTHGNQVNALKGALVNLDTGLAMLKQSLGPAWDSTVILVATEFGRTAAMNGTKGTDHGTATVAFLIGGRVEGGKVRATWPGLGQGQLFENRDLAPTADIRALAKGALAAQFGLQGAALERIFPGSLDAPPMAGLLRA
ncbi:DUF1501 domain-containing protein [Acidocella facilis]|uniref:DUF1501 domain-containing protein n=1 Tax=Acidocella facilis TaxID=525 RepID=UPI001F37E068|nr:DUF1501 domain-containing protein [Acidocella facilis]